LFLSTAMFSFSQDTKRPYSTGKAGTTIMPNRDGEFDCPANSIFSQAPVNTNNAYFSDNETNSFNQILYENFYGLTTPIDGITFWGILWNGGSCYSSGTIDFIVNFYQDNSGAAGTLVQSFPVSITPIVTGSIVSSSTVLRFDLALPSAISLTNGWLSVYRVNPNNSYCIFAWINTFNGDGYTGFTSFNSPITYWNGDNMSFCLTGEQQPPLETPVSNWALFIGIGLILAFAVIRFRRVL